TATLQLTTIRSERSSVAFCRTGRFLHETGPSDARGFLSPFTHRRGRRADKRPTRFELSSGHKPFCRFSPVSCGLGRIKNGRSRSPTISDRRPEAAYRFRRPDPANGIRNSFTVPQGAVTVAGSSLRPGPMVDEIATRLT